MPPYFEYSLGNRGGLTAELTAASIMCTVVHGTNIYISSSERKGSSSTKSFKVGSVHRPSAKNINQLCDRGSASAVGSTLPVLNKWPYSKRSFVFYVVLMPHQNPFTCTCCALKFGVKRFPQLVFESNNRSKCTTVRRMACAVSTPAGKKGYCLSETDTVQSVRLLLVIRSSA